MARKIESKTSGSRKGIASTSSARQTSARRRAAGIRETGPSARQSAPVLDPRGGMDLYALIFHTFFGRLILLAIGVLVVIGIDLLFSANHFDRFTLILGVELIVAALVLWFVYLWRNRDVIFDGGNGDEH
ncbi:MAG: hypothetical protein QM270_08645 [Bacillota bacterium]|nr:hypothetical protein [Bacillota bacterium]